MNFLRLSQSPLAVELRLDQKEAVYTDLDTVTGEIILCSESPADISSIVLTLSGTATSRLNNGRRTESHNLFIKSSRIFPSDPLMKDLKRSSVTIGGGIHVLQFSITMMLLNAINLASGHAGADRRPIY
ncbi:uncharacterized protein N7515_002135 [Penicillium bovifimosum]|uniref:Arrestin-like N-terminal domain-containing protein n=1 Tax=Penicillium bovifimosum TaxID=126998 RepID=A0A9W9HD54_9EURO|nr:uncharacterized protein N7515_002135 [Penicillium bovifimosum]KAJ5143348.1 hypothetical protein N7515_002135 [Penicillium bovifimosum]